MALVDGDEGAASAAVLPAGAAVAAVVAPAGAAFAGAAGPVSAAAVFAGAADPDAPGAGAVAPGAVEASAVGPAVADPGAGASGRSASRPTTTGIPVAACRAWRAKSQWIAAVVLPSALSSRSDSSCMSGSVLWPCASTGGCTSNSNWPATKAVFTGSLIR